jgi:hypothetical protein
LLDCFNPRGVRLFWPIPLTFHFGNVKTASGRGSMLENWQEYVFRVALACMFAALVLVDAYRRAAPFGGI